MTIPPIANADPDPTTQIPWPAARTRQLTQSHENVAPDEDGASGSRVAEENGKKTRPRVDSGRERLSTWDLITLSISMAGAQITWTVELGYDNPP